MKTLGMTGKHHSEETKRKISLSEKGKIVSEESRNKMSETKSRLFSEGKIIPSLLGKHHSKESKEKLRLAHLGKHNSPSTEFKKGRISLYGFKKGQASWNKGKQFSEGTKQKIRLAHIGMKASDETKTKMSLKNSMENNPSWLGGISFEPYGLEFNNKLKGQIRQRDNYRCQECFRHQNELKRKLHVHHLDFNKKNNNPSNLISLCNNCHAQTLFNRDKWTNYFNDVMNLRELNNDQLNNNQIQLQGGS